MKCFMCPRECGIDREKSVGRCKAKYTPTVSLVSLHKFEEPCISFKNGSGTIFFSGCNLNCVFCQNEEISQNLKGKEITIDRLSEIFLEQQERGADNINLVTPSIYVLQIKEAIIQAKEKGLNIPIVYNSSGYDKVETLKELDGLIDIYLPDLKYATNDLGEKYSNVKEYNNIAINAIQEMKRQIPIDVLDKDGKMLKGVIIRHLILPGNTKNSKLVLKQVVDNFGKDTFISIMAQYFPPKQILKSSFEELKRKITAEELKEVEEYALKLGFENGYIQELGEHEEEYVPNFNMENV